MALELIRDTLRFDQAVGEGQSQMLVDRDIIVPDIKPDIATILSVEGKVNITSKGIEHDRVSVEGFVDFEVLYTADQEPQPIYSMSQNASISHYIDVAGAAPGMEPEVGCEIEHLDFKKLNGRKLNIQCVLNMGGKVIESVPVEIVKEVGGLPDIQFLRDTVVRDEVLGEDSAQVVVRGTIQVPPGVPPADEILKHRALIHKKDVSIEEGKVVISGCVLVPVLFSCKTEEEKVDICKSESDMIFTHTMELPGVMPGMACHTDYNIEDIYTELVRNDDGEAREINAEVVVGLKAKVTERNEMPLIVDLYAPSTRMEYERKDVAMNLYHGEGLSQAIIKEALPLPEGYQEIGKIYDIICKPAVTECRVDDDKVSVEGVVGCDIIYLAKGEDKNVCSFRDEVPFSTMVSVPGCRGHMEPKVDVNIENMDCSAITKTEAEVKIAVDCLVRVFEKVSKDFIIGVGEAEGEPMPHKASITIYVVQPKDTLWQIAKRYFTTVDDIIKVNEIAEPEKVIPGLKLIIPRRA
jgi:hypothetical protein